MDEAWARQMSELTVRFYEEVGASFSATRQTAWLGWERVLDVACLAAGQGVRVFDVACGNLRFERFLAQRGLDVRALAWDLNYELVGEGAQGVCYRKVDVAEALLTDAPVWDAGWPATARPGACGRDASGADRDGSWPATAWPGACGRDASGAERNASMPASGLQGVRCAKTPEGEPLGKPVDLAVSFGFMHHLPLFEQRARLLRLLAERTRLGGHVAVAFWQLEGDARIRAKARHAPGGGEHDWLLGWQGRQDVARFCHHTTDAEIDELVASVGDVAHELARFSADGRSGELNRYVVLRVA